MRAAVVIALLAGGCDHLFALVQVGPDAPGTIGIDSPGGDGAKPGACFGTGLGLIASVCLPTGFNLAPTLTQTAINTDTDCSFTVGTLCVVAAVKIDITAAVTVTGSKPLLLLATTTLTISGSIDVASHVTGSVGPGAGICVSAVADGSLDSGGAGGSFGGLGGTGGTGGSGDPAGSPDVVVAQVTIEAGCSGGGGGGGSTMAPGGGALYMVAATKIDVAPTAWIDGSGAGAASTPMGAGGGGGGSGGLIAFDAPNVTIETGSVVFAIGGGGAGGGATDHGTGGAGNDPTYVDLQGAGGGGANAGFAGDGGSGSTEGSPTGGDGGPGYAGAIMSEHNGGGGGGGGDGYIKVFANSPHVDSTSIVPVPS